MKKIFTILAENKHRYLYIGLVVFGIIFFCRYFVLAAADKMKTTEFIVYSSTAQVNSAVNAPFSIYIGDELSGVTHPAKSIYFVISGVYTGGGTLQVSLDSDPTTIKTFNLSTVSSPTYFEFLYQDPSDKINPTTAGVYNFIFNLNPTGVTISGLGIKAVSTHRHVSPACPDGTTEKVKTTEYLVVSAGGQINSTLNAPFFIYIGDELSGVNHPTKSIYFVISGVYTGGGTLQVSLDSDPATIKTFNLSTVSSPTYFEFLYQDGVDKINPATAGVYNFTFNLNPVGVTISGLGIKAVLTHQHKPPSCGMGYPIKSDLISNVFDTSGSTGVAYNSILWIGNLGGPAEDQGRVRLQIAASNNSAGPWIFVGGSTCGSSDWFEPLISDTPIEVSCYNELNNKRYYKYKIEICSNDCVTAGMYTPTVEDVFINWSP